MADLSITDGSVISVTGATTAVGTAGATITAGQAVYSDTLDENKLKLADANGSQQSAASVGIALHGATEDQPVTYQTAGSLALGATLTVGTLYVISTGSGAIAPEGDLASGNHVTLLGVASTATNLVMNLKASGVTKA